MTFTVSLSPREKRGSPNCEIRVPPEYRDEFFPKRGKDVYINVQLPDETKFHEVKLRPSFWDSCNHFGSEDILEWIRINKYYDYPEGSPPKFHMKKHAENKFKILGLVSNKQ